MIFCTKLWRRSCTVHAKIQAHTNRSAELSTLIRSYELTSHPLGGHRVPIRQPIQVSSHISAIFTPCCRNHANVDTKPDGSRSMSPADAANIARVKVSGALR